MAEPRGRPVKPRSYDDTKSGDAGNAAGNCDLVPTGYPGGKSGAGIFQRLINLIPPHKILIVPFAGKCGVVRNIRPADHTIVIDADPDVCQWWDDWRRCPKGRRLEIHNCDGIEWLRFRFGLTEFPTVRNAAQYCDDRNSVADRDAEKCDPGSHTKTRRPMAIAATNSDAAEPQESAAPADAVIFGDPPYVLSQRAHGKQYACELSDNDHRRLLRILTSIPASVASILLCGYPSPIYSTLEPGWRTIDHRVPTRGGLQDERIWLNYPATDQLHDFRYVGKCRRSRERIRRRQRNWLSHERSRTGRNAGRSE